MTEFWDSCVRGILTGIQIKSHPMRFVFILFAVLCASCSTSLPTIKPFKLEIQQGNVVTSKMLLQLKPGMTRSQVRFIMGTPLIQDSFHGKRWDYVYQMQKDGQIIEQRRVILDFKDDLLKTVRGDVIPSTGDHNNDANVDAAPRVVEPHKNSEDKGFLQKLKFWQKNDDSLTKEANKPKASADSSVPKAVESIPVVPALAAPTVEVPAVEPAPISADKASKVSGPGSDQVVTPTSTTKPEEVAPEPAPISADKASKVSEPVSDQVVTPTSASKPEEVSPNSANVPSTKAKDLPKESDAGFFDKILEKIGF